MITKSIPVSRSLLKINVKLNSRSLTLSTNLDFKDFEKCKPILNSFYLLEDFITESEEQSLLNQVERLLKRRRYENSHFDYAIHQYKEIEFQDWNEKNLQIINKIKELGFSKVGSKSLEIFSQLNNLNGKKASELKPETASFNQRFFNSQQSTSEPSIKPTINQELNNQEASKILIDRRLADESAILKHSTSGKLNKHFVKDLNKLNEKIDNEKTNFQIIPEVHILDLNKDGYIKPHIDAVRFCGSRIIGVSLLSNAIMRLANTDDKEMIVDALLKRRSLYIMKDFSRYNCTHEILSNEESFFKGQKIERDRRISIICRCLPDKEVEERI